MQILVRFTPGCILPLLGMALLLAAAAQAQPSSGGPGPSPAAPAATDVPIDGGASLLLASGVAFGLKRLRQSKRKR